MGKKIITGILAFLLLVSFTLPSFADGEAPISVDDAQALTLGDTSKIRSHVIYSFTPNETGWVKFAVASDNSFAFYVYDADLNNIVTASFVKAPIMKLTAGKIVYFYIAYGAPQESIDPFGRNTITLSQSQAPVIAGRDGVMKIWSGTSSPHSPFQGGGYVGWHYTVNGQDPSEFNFTHYGDSFQRGGGTGIYTLEFTNYSGEHLGTLTLEVEEMTFGGYLKEIWEDLKYNWSEKEDKTTGKRLSDIGDNLWVLLRSPITVPVTLLMIIFTGPMGWALLPVAFAEPIVALFELAKDFAGFF